MSPLGHLVCLAVLLLVLPASISCYFNGTKFKHLIEHDTSNDDAMWLTTEELINRSGFQFEDYYAVADDGYISQIIRIVNPKADRSRLKYPPVMLLHGSHMDTSMYLVSSSIQHHPEPWPRKPSDGVMTSSNRSLGFMLANNGFDVWLVGSRGSNKANSAYTIDPKRSQAQQPHFRPDETMYAYSYTTNYWNYGLDDIISYELRNQIDLLRNITGFREFNYFSFSLPTLTTMAFLAENPEYARDVRLFTQMAPVVAASHFIQGAKWYWEKIVPMMPTRGIGFFPSYIVDDVIAKYLVTGMSRFSKLRYSILTHMARALFGPSPYYMTNMERNMMARIFMPVSFKSAQQYGQSSKAKKFNKFDYGSIKNLIHYNQTKPPEHKIDVVDVQNYLIVSGSLDSLADPITVQRIKEVTRTRKPIQHIIAPGFNHIDMIAGVENDKYVNLPYMELLNKLASEAPAYRPMQNSVVPGRLLESSSQEQAEQRNMLKTSLGI